MPPARQSGHRALPRCPGACVRVSATRLPAEPSLYSKH
ncbi:hypothetical protein CU044_3851 [Streptomyces sp. L-9-10]|nr:hypothetical protein CU044_3851 [Streptomyces sp. L-9-10]